MTEPAARLSGSDVGTFIGALVAARDSFGMMTRAISKDYGIGRRGPWMIGIIGRNPVSPAELAKINRIGRSLVTAELNQLHEAGLIVYRKNERDGRRIELSLTPRGQGVYNRLADDLAAMLQRRLAGYSRDEIMACAQMLGDFADHA